MQRSKDESVSVWQTDEMQEPVFSTLADNLTTEICIVGAGIAGLTIGYLLAKEGKSVVILDAWGLASGETSRTTAHLTAVLDDRFYNLESLFGVENSRLAAESHMAAINRIENIIKAENIDCDFERLDGYLVALEDDQKDAFNQEHDALRRAGFADMDVHTHVPVPGIQLSAPTMRFPQQGTFHATKYMTGLANTFLRLGGQIYTGSHVNEVKGGKAAYVKTDNGMQVQASHVVVATNTPVNDWVKMHTKQAAYRTYVVGFEIPKDSYPNFLLWDMQDPYHYVRIVRGSTHDVLIVGGEDHKTGQAQDPADRYRRLEQWTQRYFATIGAVKYRWSGQVMEPIDSLAFIGRNPGDEHNVYIATGDSGNGMTHGTIAGMLIADLIQGRPNAYEKLYDPARKTLKAVPCFIKENANAAERMVADRIKGSKVESALALRSGEGAVLRDGTSKIAVYKDENGQLHERSAVCPHLGCIVQWNPGEKSWDCPCHGSRFGINGEILNGPATKPLDTLEAKSPRKASA
ncbi:MAG TPA: FAD-dependent oxidoreductase [Rickettsiales bacterium]|nr:FAD-dependent oxidoreductase [Rickettsiales bacterium]